MSASDRALYERLRDAIRDGVRLGMYHGSSKELALREAVRGCCSVPKAERRGRMPSPCGNEFSDDLWTKTGSGPEHITCWCGHTAGCHARRARCAVHGGGNA